MVEPLRRSFIMQTFSRYDDRLRVERFRELFFDELFLEELFFEELFFDELRLRGTLAPFFRASERPIAIACLRLFTVPPLPPRPLFSVPFFRRRIALATFLLAARPYFRPPDFRPDFLPLAMKPPAIEEPNIEDRPRVVAHSMPPRQAGQGSSTA